MKENNQICLTIVQIVQVFISVRCFALLLINQMWWRQNLPSFDHLDVDDEWISKIEVMDRWNFLKSIFNISNGGREPRSSSYGRRRLMSWRSWVRLLAPYTGWTFFTLICCKNCRYWCFFEKTKKETGDGPFWKMYRTVDYIGCRKFGRIPASFARFPSFQATFIPRTNSVGSNSERESIRWACWPLNHHRHHGFIFYSLISLLYDRDSENRNGALTIYAKLFC